MLNLNHYKLIANLVNFCKVRLQILIVVNSYLIHLCTNNNFFKKLLKKTIVNYCSIVNYLTLENYRYIYINISKAHAKECLV
jgi:hypothetical protein